MTLCSKCKQHPAAGMKLRKCGACLASEYCTNVCQREDWPDHKLVCKSMGAVREKTILPLINAAASGNEAAVKRLLKAGARGDLASQDGRTVIFMAAQEGHAKVVTDLLKAGAKADKPVDDGLTPMHIAASRGHKAVLQALLRAGASTDVLSNGPEKRTPLLGASLGGHKASVMLLIEAGAGRQREQGRRERPYAFDCGSAEWKRGRGGGAAGSWSRRDHIHGRRQHGSIGVEKSCEIPRR